MPATWHRRRYSRVPAAPAVRGAQLKRSVTEARQAAHAPADAGWLAAVTVPCALATYRGGQAAPSEASHLTSLSFVRERGR